MSEYTSNKWGKIYRCRAPYDLVTGEFIRNPDGSLDTTDIYVECQGDDQMFDTDSRKSIMEAYIASKQRGRKIVSEIYDSVYGDFKKFVTMVSYLDKNEQPQERKDVDWDGFYNHVNSLKNFVIWKIVELDNEVYFNFNGKKSMEFIATYMNPKKPMASTTPFNVKFLPSHKEKLAQKKLDNERYVEYQMPTGFWDVMRNTIVPAMARKYECKIDKALEKCYKLFSKKKKVDFVKLADENNYKLNHYIHHLGLWNEFIEFLELHIKS